MSEVKAFDLPETEIAARRQAMRDAIASARIEGGTVSDEARAIMELHNLGHIDDDEMMRRIRLRHVRG